MPLEMAGFERELGGPGPQQRRGTLEVATWAGMAGFFSETHNR